MAPKGKGENSRKVAGNAQKAESAALKAAAEQAKKDAAEASEWAKGSKSNDKKEAAERKKAETAAKKAEADRLLREEEAALPDKAKGAGAKQATRRPGINMDQLNDISASGVDNALEALKLTSGDQAVKIDRNPQRRKAAAYEAFKARRLPEIRADPQYRGLRLQQMVNQVHKEFEKSPENPMNNIGNVAYNAKQGDVKAVRSHVKENLEMAYAGNPGKK